MTISRREALYISGSTLTGLSLGMLTRENPRIKAITEMVFATPGLPMPPLPA